MDNLLGTQLQIFHIESLGRLAGFLTLFPVFLVSCAILLLISWILMIPICLAWFIYDAAREELDFFSFPVVLRSITEDFAAFIGLKQDTVLIYINHEDNGCYHMSLGTKAIHPRRQSFISDFSEPEEMSLNRGNPKKKYNMPLAGTNTSVSKTITSIARRVEGYSIITAGVPIGHPLQSNISDSPSPSYLSAASILSIEGVLRTPKQELFDFSRRNISPHWSAGKPMTKNDTPSPLELSPGELEYSDEYMSSPKRWPSPASDTGYLAAREDSLRARLQKEIRSGNTGVAERIFVADDVGNTHIVEADTQTQVNTTNAQHVDHKPWDYLPSPLPKLERKLFTTSPQDKLSVGLDIPAALNGSTYQKIDNVPINKYSGETSLTIGWSRKYKDLIAEMKLKGPLGRQESEDDDQSKIENFKPMKDTDPHWMDTPRLEPLERPRLNKLQRWGLVNRVSRANLIAQDVEEIGSRSVTPTPNESPSLQVSPITLREDYNFGNLLMSPEKRGGQSDPDDDEYSKYWEGFDETYNIRDSKSPESSGDEEKWKLSMGKWAEKGVEVMRPVNEEGREDGSIVLSSGLKIAPSPVSPSSDRDPLLLHGSVALEDENFHTSYHLSHPEGSEPRTPSPLLPLSTLGGKIDTLEDKKDSSPLEETSNRLFSRMARASRPPVSSSPTLTSPPRPLPVKLIRMFEDLSRPVLINTRSSSINSSPERIHSSPDRNEGYRMNEVRGLRLDTRNARQATTPSETEKISVSDPKKQDDGLNECF